jgi:ribosomal protein S18 acetylase RimI-like enzyme
MFFTLRHGTPEDIDDLLALWLDAAENDGRPADTPGAVAALLQRDPEALIVADDDGKLIGSVIAGWDGWRYHLYRLAVRAEWRRRGVGTALLEAAEARLAGFGATRADAMVLDGNDLGQRLWRARGYRQQADWRRWVKQLRLRRQWAPRTMRVWRVKTGGPHDRRNDRQGPLRGPRRDPAEL